MMARRVTLVVIYEIYVSTFLCIYVLYREIICV